MYQKTLQCSIEGCSEIVEAHASNKLPLCNKHMWEHNRAVDAHNNARKTTKRILKKLYTEFGDIEPEQKLETK